MIECEFQEILAEAGTALLMAVSQNETVLAIEGLFNRINERGQGLTPEEAQHLSEALTFHAHNFVSSKRINCRKRQGISR